MNFCPKRKVFDPSFNHLLLSPKKKKNVICFLWGQLTPKLLFKLRGLGLWPNNPVRGREHIRELLVKEEMKTVLWEEVKYIYGGPNHI